MKRFFCVGWILLLCLTMMLPSLTAASGTTPPYGATLYGEHYYAFFSDNKNWTEAKTFCEELGGHLVTITSKEENDFVYNLCGQRQIWLGASDAQSEGVFRWVTGEPFAYTNWHSGEPNNSDGNQNYLQFYQGNAWDDTWDYDDDSKGFVCEWDGVCISSGNVRAAHDWGEETVLSPASCQIQGKASHTCRHCGAQEEYILSALGTHVWGEETILFSATCDADGCSLCVCSRCGSEENRNLPALGHKYGEVTILSGNALIPPIVKERTCERCDHLDHIEDWSYVWVTVLAGVGAIAFLAGVIAYAKAFRKKP